MKRQYFFLWAMGALLVSSCTVQHRTVNDELYQTPPDLTGQEITVHRQSDTADQPRSSDTDNPRIQSAPYWMYEHYPYHPYYYGDWPFDTYFQFHFYAPFYAHYPFNPYYSFYPYSPYFYGSWYGYYGYYAHYPFHRYWWYDHYNPYYPYYHHRTVQRKAALNPAPAGKPPIATGRQYERVRKTAPGEKRKDVFIDGRKTRPNLPARNIRPERYRRAIKPLQSQPGRIEPFTRKFIPQNTPDKRSYTVPFHPNNRKFTPTRRPVRIRKSTPPIRRSAPVRSNSSGGRKRK